MHIRELQPLKQQHVPGGSLCRRSICWQFACKAHFELFVTSMDLYPPWSACPHWEIVGLHEHVMVCVTRLMSDSWVCSLWGPDATEQSCVGDVAVKYVRLEKGVSLTFLLPQHCMPGAWASLRAAQHAASLIGPIRRISGAQALCRSSHIPRRMQHHPIFIIGRPEIRHSSRPPAQFLWAIGYGCSCLPHGCPRDQAQAQLE